MAWDGHGHPYRIPGEAKQELEKEVFDRFERKAFLLFMACCIAVGLGAFAIGMLSAEDGRSREMIACHDMCDGKVSHFSVIFDEPLCRCQEEGSDKTKSRAVGASARP